MKNNLRSLLASYFELGKVKIMLPVSLTGFTGYFIFDPVLSAEILLCSLGILFMAISSAALNQVQERDLDSRMNRTSKRPLPSGKLSLSQALIFSTVFMISGVIVLYFSGNLLSALLGIFTMIWYNGVYTSLKRITAFAVVPGALTGALPPLIGWTAAGGNLSDKPIIILCFLLFIGQVPHFWLLIMKYGQEYEKAGIPSLTQVFSIDQINRLTFTWIIISAISSVFLIFSGMINSLVNIIILSSASVFIILRFSRLIRENHTKINYTRYFIMLNSYFLLILVLIISDRINLK